MDVEPRIIKEETCLDTGGGGAEVPDDDGGGGGEGSRAAATNNNNDELPDEEGDHHPPHHHHHHRRRRPSKTVYSLNMNVCRLCLCEGHDNLQPVFYGKDELDAVLQQKIHELTTVEITYATDFPTAVCVDCLTKLEEWAIYRRQCIDNNEMLRVKYLELKSELDCYREPQASDAGDHQHYQQQQQQLRRSPAVKEEQEVLRLMDEGDADGQMNGGMTCEEAIATAYGHELGANGSNEIIIGADGATTKIQYVNEDGTMTEYVTAAPTGAVIRKTGSAAGLDDQQQQQQQQEELRIEGDGDPYADGPQDDERHEIYYTVGTDGAYAIHANAATGYAGAQPGSYVPQGFENQTEIECTTIQEHLPEEYVEEGIISPASLSAAAAAAAAGPAMIATSARGAHDRPFVCKHCKTSFKYEHNYDRHMKNHAKVLYRCGKCSKTFVKLRKCQQHFMKAHSSQRYECDICFRTYSLPTRLENHVIEMHSKNGVYSCDRCRGEQFASYLDFKAHRMTQHPRNNDSTVGGGGGTGNVGSEATIPAIIKQTAYGDVVHMQQILTPLGTPFEDPDADGGSPSSDGAEMDTHVDGRNNRRGSANSKPTPVAKSRPGSTGVTRTRRPNGRLGGAGGKKSSPRKQVSLVPVIPAQQEVILIDDDEQRDNNGMELNGAGSSGLDASGNALHRQLLQQIEESEANSLGPKLYPCESCSHTFAHLNNLKAHIYAEHDNDKPFKCKLCPISFKTKEILVMHMLLHSQHSSTI